ncbi:MAG: cellulase family glycosylhydrolase [Candidatus Omnitrophota bacterium]
MNYRRIFVYITLLVFLVSNPAFAKTINVASRPKKVIQYEPLILELTLPYFSVNPNDPTNVDLRAKITSPSGKEISMPAFCRQNSKSDNESLWEVRFTPTEKGRYSYFVDLDSGFVRDKTDVWYFNVVQGKKDGFLRKSDNNDYYLTFDSGKPFFGIGHNVAWVHNNRLAIFDRYFSKLEENGCNMVRVWMCDWSFPIEWKKIGEYDRRASSKLDELIELAGKKNIYIMLCFDTYGSLMGEGGQWGEDRWGVNPYNAKNGGPCEKPRDFFTDPEAKEAYKNRLRYIISRWSYSPNIMAFEMWNEFNSPREWVKEMALYMKSINPHAQLVTTSLGYPYGEIFDESKIWSLDEVDLVTVHIHSNAVKEEMVPSLVRRAEELTDRYGKPCVISELGIDNARDDLYYDPEGKGTALHNSIWCTALSRYFGTAMNWWWDKYIRPKELYYHYEALSRFLRGIDWDSGEIKLARTGAVRNVLTKGQKTVYKDKTIKPVDKWGKIYFNEFTALSNGDLLGAGEPNKYLHGEAKKDFKADLVFYVDYPASGELVIKVDMVSQGAHLKVYVDEKEVLSREFLTGPGEGPWKRSLYRKDHKIYQAVYDEDVVISIPKGKHVIKLVNTGKDWLGVKRVILKDYVDSSIANARCLGLIVGKDMIFWVQNKDFNWRNTFKGKAPEPIKNSYFNTHVIEDGSYLIERWDTFTGKVVSKIKADSKNGILRVELPEFSKDSAFKIRKAGSM